ncbi:MAG: undecaprenyldiphospho-muramoylpentapeptide beta-N-acetylglucosaminyltransferase [Acidobacteriota bacterium]
MRKQAVIFTGGGTGGHLYPAIAVSNKLREKAPELRLVFVGSKRKIEETLMKKEGIEFFKLPIKGLKGRGLRALDTLMLLPFAFLKSLIIFLKVRPCLVVGAGSYSAGPLVLLASMMKTPALILEQNLFPGYTNRLLLPKVDKAVVAFEESLPYFKGKGVFLGNPVREDFYSIPPKERTGPLTLLIFGGSQGSHFLNLAVLTTLPFLQKEKNSLMIFHQTGPKDLELVKTGYQKHSFRLVKVAAYFHNMAEFFSKSDLIICRAGATTIAEIIAAKKTALLIPFSRATEGHQLQNARLLAEKKAAELMTEENFSPENLAAKILGFLENRESLDQFERNLDSFRSEDTAGKIAGLCFQMMKNRKKE